jgi:hypothetical protein
MSDELTRLEAKVTNALIAVESAHGTALDRALEAGDVLREIVRRQLVRYGDREALYARTCGSVRVGQNCVQLSEGRAVIEAENTNRDSCLTITAALRLVRKSDTKPKRTSTSKPEAAAKVAEAKATKPEKSLPDFSKMSDADLTAGLERIGFARLLKVLPKGWHAQLNDHALAMTKSKFPKVQADLSYARKQLAQVQRNHPGSIH